MHNAKWEWMCGFFVVFDLPSVEMLIFSLNFDRFDPFQSLERQFYCHNTGCVWLWGGGSLGLLTLHLPASTLHLCWKKMIFLDIFTSCALPDGIVKKTVVAKTGSKYELKKNFIFLKIWRLYGGDKLFHFLLLTIPSCANNPLLGDKTWEGGRKGKENTKTKHNNRDEKANKEVRHIANPWSQDETRSSKGRSKKCINSHS